MKKLLASDKIYIKTSKISNAGRGVFAKCEIKKGEIIETCPIIKVSRHDTANLNESVLTTYFFYFGKEKEQLAVALGFGSIYNHSCKPNAKYKISKEEGIINFVALSDIKKEEEITFNYKSENSKNNRPLWFEVGSSA
ncbi:SET domain-containing protein-lysine N-methyltransferase [Patescibacteria group bacterium]|nr:SET domain-containing protein-lysine N-methyltransferase [Patescibacteria group bacterium]